MRVSTALYFDHNSTTPLDSRVAAAMRSFENDCFANPASSHRAGQKARQALEDARETVARCLECEPVEVIFTSGATESNNLALFGLADRPGDLIATTLEHPSVRGPLEQMRNEGWRLLDVPVSGTGMIEAISLQRAITPATVLISLQLANHEIGVIQPVAQLAAVAGDIPVHCDATQAVGKLPVSFRQLGVATLAASAHKFNGPKGVGILLVRRDVRLRARQFGGHQQRGLRPGTEPVGLAVGLATALDLAVMEMADRTRRLMTLRERFLRNLADIELCINGPAQGGLPHTLNLSFPGHEAVTLLMKLDLAGVYCSAGAACASGALEPSPTLRALGLSAERLNSALRFSLGHQQTVEEIDSGAARLRAVLHASARRNFYSQAT